MRCDPGTGQLGNHRGHQRGSLRYQRIECQHDLIAGNRNLRDRREIERVKTATREIGHHEAGIFDAHLMLLSDEAVLADVKARVNAGDGAARAWTEALAVVERAWAVAIPAPICPAPRTPRIPSTDVAGSATR